jgi:hypothetical protein
MGKKRGPGEYLMYAGVQQSYLRVPQPLYDRLRIKAAEHGLRLREIYEAALLAACEWTEAEVHQHIPPLPHPNDIGTSRYYKRMRAARKRWTKWITGNEQKLDKVAEEVENINNCCRTP